MMSIHEQIVIITDQDLPRCENLAIQGDCGDCACPDDSFTLTPTVSYTDAAAYVVPMLHIDELADGFALAFNPLGHAGVVVLNQAALGMLNTFRQPRTLAEGVRAAGVPAGGLDLARRLADLNLLEPPGVQQVARRSAPQT